MFSPNFSPAPMAMPPGRCFSACSAGAGSWAAAVLACAASNWGDSLKVERTHQPTATSTAESRKATRHPQPRKSASLRVAAITAITPAASRLPAGTPTCGQPAQVPRRLASPNSPAISTAPPHSPPTAKPCTNRSIASSTGAATPICA